ncbi:P-loop containing nucleoside triphosphate hydrolase protein [Tothia fuscella]|uniref:Adenylate kinase isoenzyme 6 homolog n=1 Tax=Tothia fuscella TaxID=1048955 RepID=A0A9P4NF18_9PEZI|nr:P-loop containing nucleoside triphosphate hydrolase protein [Tothia fuscella]
MRKSPNIIVTGTPGVGKTSHAELLAEKTGLQHLAINKVAEEQNCYDGRDEELQTWIVDEDKLLDALEAEVPAGGYILDWHACDLFPKSWIDLVVVLRCDSTVLYDRLTSRNYSSKKLEENIDAEIMQVILEEAWESYDGEIVIEMQSDSLENIDENVERIQTWFEQWKKDHAEEDKD